MQDGSPGYDTDDENVLGANGSPSCHPEEYASVISHFTDSEVVQLLDELLEGERAGARGINEMGDTVGNTSIRQFLQQVARDEAFFCAMLTRHLIGLGATPTRKLGRFYFALQKRQHLQDKLVLLDRGQRAVVQVLEEAIPRIADCRLSADLIHMRDVHIHNIESGRKFIA